MINPWQFRLLVIRPVLQYLGMWSLAAERLLLGTALAESWLMQIKQRPGPALSFYQIEPETHADIWKHYLAFRPLRAAKVASLASGWVPRHKQLAGNMNYATAIARLVYWRDKRPLPGPEDAEGMAKYHKRVYNTSLGKARWEKNVGIFKAVVEEKVDWQTIRAAKSH